MIRLDRGGGLCVDVVDSGQLLPIGRYLVRLESVDVSETLIVERYEIVEPESFRGVILTLSEGLEGS